MSLIVFLNAAAISFAITAAWLWLARRRQWLDHPNFRSSHQVPTPKSGGIGFVVGFFSCVLLLFINDELSGTDVLLFSGGLLLAVLGLLDDMKGLGIRSRLAVQALAVISVLPFLQALPPMSFGPGFSVGGWWLVALVGLALMWLINLYNFMDGIDALAATQAIFFSLAVALCAGIKGETTLVLLLLCLAASVSGFLYFNIPVAKVFMGDLGSNFLGFTLGVLGLWAVKVAALNHWALVLLLGTFVVDSTITLSGRWVSGAVWYHPHRTHGYQHAALLLNSHGRVVVINLLINLLWLSPLAIVVQRKPEWGALLALAGLAPLAGLVVYLRKDKERITE